MLHTVISTIHMPNIRNLMPHGIMRTIWLRRSRRLIKFLFVVALALALLTYVIKNWRLQTGNTPIRDSALDEQLQALRLSPWHDNAVGNSKVCQTRECVDAAYDLLFGMNHTADPCHDFYEFACANWIKHQKDQGLLYNSKFSRVAISEDALVEEILMRAPESYEFQPMKIASVHFRQCVNESQTNCLLLTKNDFNVPIMLEYLKAKASLKARAVVDQMAASIVATFHKILESNHWLSDAGKLIAKKKLNSLKTFIGYPNWLLNTTEMERRFQGNQLHAGSTSLDTSVNFLVWAASNEMSPYFRIIKHKEPWFTGCGVSEMKDGTLILPCPVRAFYLPRYNQLVVPMGLIQPHFFYNNTPSYVNYGRIGSVIGHEISHAFHVSRKNVDENGQFINEGWTDEDQQSYDTKSSCYRDQYDKFEILPGIFVNGSRCLDENIADNLGIKMAYLAYKDHYARAVEDHQSLPGFEKLSAEQLFFLSYGSLRCEHADQEMQKQSLLVNVHSPGKARINGVLQNSPEFADAWNCPVGSPMNPIDKCTLW